MSESGDNQEPGVWNIKNPREFVSRLMRGKAPPDVARIEFEGLTFEVSNGSTIPPSEETYRHAKTLGNALQKISEIPNTEYPIRVVDVGTGSGVIAITLAKILENEIKDNNIILAATDISEKALHDAQKNALANNVDGISFVKGDTLDFLREEKADVIICNPPFMKSSILERYGKATSFIPPEAVIAGETGMDFYRKLFTGAKDVLSKRGIVVVQHQDFDREKILEIAKESFEESVAVQDLYGNRQTGLAIGNPEWLKVLS